jgi:outer membrane immunogenic protein
VIALSQFNSDRRGGGRFAFAIFAALTAAPAAFAADIPLGAPIYAKAPPPAPVYNWTGFYIGGNVGGAWEKASGTSNWFEAGEKVSPAFVSNTPQANSLNSSSVIGGVHGGYNWQVKQWVLGVEGDWDWTHAKTGFCRITDFGLPCSDDGSGFLTMNSATDWTATARGRLGFTWDRFLIYGTGGAAWGKVDTTINANCLVDGCGSSFTKLNTTGSFSDTRVGWVAGAGVEAMLTPNWIVRAEYLHIDLGSVSDTLSLAGTFGPQSATWSRAVTVDEVRAGISYKLN